MQQTTSREMVPQQPDRITIDEIVKREQQGEQFTYVDTRNEKAWQSSDVEIPGALRIPLDRADQQLANINKGRSVITYCT